MGSVRVGVIKCNLEMEMGSIELGFAEAFHVLFDLEGIGVSEV